jgi:uncharacterized protein with PQ loop repeat
MSEIFLIHLFGVLLTAISAITIIPQAIHVKKTKSIDGLSIGTIKMALVTQGLWLTYTSKIMDLYPFLASLIPFMIWLYIGYFYIKVSKENFIKNILYLIIFSIALIIFFTILSSNIIGYMASIFSASYAIPQLIKSFKSKKLDGVSHQAYLLIAFENGLWIYYGILLSNIIYIIPTFIQGSATLIIGVRTYIYERRKNLK